MTWKQRHQLGLFLRSSLWPVPLAFMVVGLVTGYGLPWLDHLFGWTLRITATDARTVGGTLAGSLLAFIVFIFSFFLVAVQLASAQLSPRVIARVFKDPYTKYTLALFVFTYTYSIVFMSRLTDPVPFLSGILCGYGTLTCLAAFLFLIDHLGKELRPVRLLTSVAADARKVIHDIYPHVLSADVLPCDTAIVESPGQLHRVVHHVGDPGVLLAFDDDGLLSLAERANCVIELVPQVGDFTAPDDPLFRVYGGGDSIDEKRLRHSLAFGSERTLEQDPAFAFRMIVDIASKALSPAINDPTTAVLAIDQLHHLLRLVGSRQLDTGQDRDTAGKLRLMYRTPDWEDFVQLAVTEIRQFGGESIQVNRRLRAMLDNLIQTLPQSRRDLLREELRRLHRSAERCFPEPEDRALAELGDFQGVGGTLASRRAAT